VNATERTKFRKHLEWATKIVATWPPWKRNLLEDSLKSTCPRREGRYNESFRSKSSRS
jgi:hypothetical protein